MLKTEYFTSVEKMEKSERFVTFVINVIRSSCNRSQIAPSDLQIKKGFPNDPEKDVIASCIGIEGVKVDKDIKGWYIDIPRYSMKKFNSLGSNGWEVIQKSRHSKAKIYPNQFYQEVMEYFQTMFDVGNFPHLIHKDFAKGYENLMKKQGTKSHTSAFDLC